MKVGPQKKVGLALTPKKKGYSHFNGKTYVFFLRFLNGSFGRDHEMLPIFWGGNFEGLPLDS